jgi:hypothetical protein
MKKKEINVCRSNYLSNFMFLIEEVNWLKKMLIKSTADSLSSCKIKPKTNTLIKNYDKEKFVTV